MTSDFFSLKDLGIPLFCCSLSCFLGFSLGFSLGRAYQSKKNSFVTVEQVQEIVNNAVNKALSNIENR